MGNIPVVTSFILDSLWLQFVYIFGTHQGSGIIALPKHGQRLRSAATFEWGIDLFIAILLQGKELCFLFISCQLLHQQTLRQEIQRGQFRVFMLSCQKKSKAVIQSVEQGKQRWDSISVFPQASFFCAIVLCSVRVTLLNSTLTRNLWSYETAMPMMIVFQDLAKFQ